jgi:hypothetical protein
LTLTEVLLDGGADPSGNGNTLPVAVRPKRTDIVRLLLDCEGSVNAVDFESVCYSGDPESIEPRWSTEIALNCTFHFSGSCLLVVSALGYSNPWKQLLIAGDENA